MDARKTGAIYKCLSPILAVLSYLKLMLLLPNTMLTKKSFKACTERLRSSSVGISKPLKCTDVSVSL